MFLELKDVHFSYMKGTKLERTVLREINLDIKEGEIIGLVGPTGSGKSTLIQHFNGLLRPDKGKVFVEGKAIGDTVAARLIRRKIGLVFQFPEKQFFEETIFDEVAFGARNMGFSEEDLEEQVSEAISMVGLDINRFRNRSPLALSGGEMRRVAIASVLAMKPKVLILDEPTSGLDANGKDEIYKSIFHLREKENMTVILVSHEMDEIVKIAERIVLIDQGRIILDDATEKIIGHTQELKKIGLGIPQITTLFIELSKRGFNLPLDICDLEEAKTVLLRHFH